MNFFIILVTSEFDPKLGLNVSFRKQIPSDEGLPHVIMKDDKMFVHMSSTPSHFGTERNFMYQEICLKTAKLWELLPEVK